jgi:hypothetical protein
MKVNARLCAVALTLGMAAAPVLPVLAQPIASMQDRDDQNRHDQDRDRGYQDHDRNDQNRDRDDRNNNQWANNKYYKMGEKDADNDRRHNRHGKHNHKFKHDDDRRAYEAGYNGYSARGPR